MAKPAKKVLDKWKAKKKFEVIAPDIFNNTPIGPIFANEAKDLEGRIVETTLSKLVNSNQHHVKVRLKILGTQGFNAVTLVKEVELSRAYLSSQTTPGIDIIEDVFSAETQDGKNVRFKIILFTKGKAHSEQKKALRLLARESITSSAGRMEYPHLVQEVVFGKLGSQVFNRGKKIVPMGRIEVRKFELLS